MHNLIYIYKTYSYCNIYSIRVKFIIFTLNDHYAKYFYLIFKSAVCQCVSKLYIHIVRYYIVFRTCFKKSRIPRIILVYQIVVNSLIFQKIVLAL